MKGSSDVKGSLWNHLDKKVLLWHHEAPLFLRAYAEKKLFCLIILGETVIYLFFWNFLESFGKTVIIWNRNRNTVNLFIAICDQYNASLKK